jgi:hypothetical protein
MMLDTKTYWLTDRQSQCNFDFDLTWLRLVESPEGFSSRDYKDENGAWNVTMNWVQIRTGEYKVIEDEITRRLHYDLKC